MSARRRGEAPSSARYIGPTWLAADAQRTGINTHAKLLMLAHAFDARAVHRVTLKTDARNVRSRMAIQRIGGRPDGVLRAHMRAFDGAVRDTASFSTCRSSKRWTPPMTISGAFGPGAPAARPAFPLHIRVPHARNARPQRTLGFARRRLSRALDVPQQRHREGSRALPG